GCGGSGCCLGGKAAAVDGVGGSVMRGDQRWSGGGWCGSWWC
nr:hypothetical protein [Tanacetum cinerariifolium]